MEIRPEWVAIVLTALGMGGAIGSWIERRRNDARQAMPIFRATWASDEKYLKLGLTIVNRLDEDIMIESIAVPTLFKHNVIEQDVAGRIARSWLEPRASPMALNALIVPGAQLSKSFLIEGGSTERVAIIRISSSSRTLRSKRFAIRDSQKP